MLQVRSSASKENSPIHASVPFCSLSVCAIAPVFDLGDGLRLSGPPRRAAVARAEDRPRPWQTSVMIVAMGTMTRRGGLAAGPRARACRLPSWGRLVLPPLTGATGP